MPLDLSTKLDLSTTDPHLALSVGNSIAPQDEYLALHLGGDYTKYLAMRRDTEVRRSLTRLRLAIQARDLVVEASSEARADLKAADQVRSLLGLGGGRAKLRYESLTSTLLDSGMVCGFAVLRLDYHEHGDLLLPSFQFVPQNRFAFTHHRPDDRSIPVCTGEDLDPATEITTVGGYELRLLTRKHPFTGERCPIKRFLVYTFDGDGSPWGLGLGYSIWPWWTIKNEARKAWLLHSDRAGSPPILGTHPVNFSEKIPDQATVLQSFNNFLRAVSPQGWARLPQGFTAQTLDTVGKAGSEVHEGLIRTANHEICKVILGEVLYSDQSSGSYAANISQVEDRESGLIDGYCNLLDEQLSDFWLWIHEVNRLPGDPPIVRRETRADLRSAERAEQEEKAKQSRIDRDKSLLELGIRLKPDRVAQVYGEDYIDTAAVAAEEDGGEPQQALFSQLQTGGTQALIGFITGFAQSGLSKDNAIALLKSVFGIPSDPAAALLPDIEEAAEDALPLTPEETADLLDQDFAESAIALLDTDDIAGFKAAIDEVYQDGVERITQIAVDAKGDIRFVFEDVNGRTVRRFVGKVITPDTDPQIVYRLAAEDEFAESIEFAAKPKAKKKNCKPGRSMACGNSCISLKKTCRSSQPISDTGKAQIKAVKQKLSPAAPASPTPTADRAIEFPSKEDFASASYQKLSISSGAGSLGLISKTTIDGREYFVKQADRQESKIETLSYQIAREVGLGDITVPIAQTTIKNRSHVVMPFLSKEEAATIDNTRALRSISDSDAMKVTLFDYLIGNTDRHAGNIGVSQGRPLLFDHGFAFHEVTQSKQRLPVDRLDVAVNTIVRDKFGYDTSNRDNPANRRVRSREFSPEDVQRILASREQIIAATRSARVDPSGITARLDRLQQLSQQGKVTLGDILHEPPPRKEDTSLNDFFGGLSADQLALLRGKLGGG